MWLLVQGIMKLCKGAKYLGLGIFGQTIPTIIATTTLFLTNKSNLKFDSNIDQVFWRDLYFFGGYNGKYSIIQDHIISKIHCHDRVLCLAFALYAVAQIFHIFLNWNFVLKHCSC